jgi:hypothetical protein
MCERCFKEVFFYLFGANFGLHKDDADEDLRAPEWLLQIQVLSRMLPSAQNNRVRDDMR